MRGFLYFFLSTATCSPVYRKKAHDISALFTKILKTATDLSSSGTGNTEELFALSNQLLNNTNGKIKPIQTIDKGLAALSNIQNTTSLQRAISIVSAGLVPSNMLSLLDPNNPINSHTNKNQAPSTPIYPKSPSDAPYDIPESNLLSALYIPQEFTCTKIPILLVPGTAAPAGTTFSFSYSKLLPTTSPTWVNIPENSLSDIQNNAQYIAYAINYLYNKCKQPIGVLSWSQGALDVQWALKYWPSTRESVSDFMAVSADFHGTVVQSLCVLDEALCTPSILQQGYESRFVRALRSQDGDSAYVPTTSVYSSVDFVVRPQSGMAASGMLRDVRGVGVTNVQVQIACAGRPGGGFYSHGAMLVHPLVYALFVDALGHEGPGRVERVGVGACEESLAPGLGIGDFLGTEAVSDVLGPIEVLLYRGDGRGSEPILKDYVVMG